VPPQTATPEPEPQEEEYLVQDIEEAPVIEKKKEEPKKKLPEPVKPKPEPVKEVVEPQPEPQPQVNPKAMFKGSSTSTTQGGQEGITGQPGDQGNPNGKPGVENYEGTGGAGDGISFSLGGRGSLKLYKPSYDSKEQGKVVVTIKVDRQGNVTSAKPGAKGTNVSDQSLWNVAMDAALRSKFSPDPNAPDFQTGTITYNFIRQN
jgi:TonB family protein